MVMKDQDLNDDGFIDYPEYINYYTKFEKGESGPPSDQPQTTMSPQQKLKNQENLKLV